MSLICGVINLEKEESEEKKEGIIDWIRIIIVMLLFLPFLIIGAILIFIYIILEGRDWKCKHWKECSWYNPKNITCNEDMGMYSGFDKPAGCFISVSERKEELKKQGKVLRRLR